MPTDVIFLKSLNWGKVIWNKREKTLIFPVPKRKINKHLRKMFMKMNEIPSSTRCVFISNKEVTK